MSNKRIVSCPFYVWRYKTSITCENIENNLGFALKNQLRFESGKEAQDYYELFCTDRYANCPYYQAIYRKEED